MKRNEDSLWDLWDKIKCTKIHIIGILEGEEREKEPEKNIWRDNSWKLPKYRKRNIQQSPLSTESSRQGKPKEEHIETHGNQNVKIKYKDKILKATKEKW